MPAFGDWGTGAEVAYVAIVEPVGVFLKAPRKGRFFLRNFIFVADFRLFSTYVAPRGSKFIKYPDKLSRNYQFSPCTSILGILLYAVDEGEKYIYIFVDQMLEGDQAS